ncbi:FMN-binding domain protein (plasmid) [Natrialba magadii ATCC 43099]|uniref:FMN-binding domain protein n=1 Tax=Natrialba magadii (strain ATCC 43099 / DSM 3394 / CCM 3739 / CIP 104546 / IAM 13178 / JCM 8861 / NBRC 102185 / NCIMB 2190 / MS3) TaxID=547559 RepID=D3T164_NATMM|nr:pyridoxamine 5'-phosphate oxidase family protein [Natrialba magadii]ADD07323.1 FMN-binding domain protein [Natrialba magadii ATCC 43099]ELY32704.1 pyridoxamine 5'-phosphate oxidase-like FMN-binding protein [Natrialba magadii ATCC 43099]
MATEALTDEEIDAFLREHGTGVLSVADGSDAYAIPQSFGYDGEDLYFQFVSAAHSSKQSFAEQTETATFTVYDDEPAQSVIARGALAPVSADESTHAMSVIAENAMIPTVNISPDTPVPALSFQLYRLQPTELTGRTFGPVVDNSSQPLPEPWSNHLENALQCDDPEEKDYHIRQAFQLSESVTNAE